MLPHYHDPRLLPHPCTVVITSLAQRQNNASTLLLLFHCISRTDQGHFQYNSSAVQGQFPHKEHPFRPGTIPQKSRNNSSLVPGQFPGHCQNHSKTVPQQFQDNSGTRPGKLQYHPKTAPGLVKSSSSTHLGIQHNGREVGATYN